MKGRLTLLNLVLFGLALYAGWVLRERWLGARVREMKLLSERVSSPAAPVLAPIPAVGQTQSAAYVSVAQQLAFARDRNPNVVLDPPAPPPPPPAMPPLPVAYGVIDLGEGPTVILSPKSGAEAKGYRAGEMIGEFKVVAMNTQEILFEWSGKRLKKTLDELLDRNPQANEPPPPQQAAAAAGVSSTNLAEVKSGPGVAVGGETRACQPNDPAPAGTVMEGMRKVITETPFGKSCRWEPVK